MGTEWLLTFKIAWLTGTYSSLPSIMRESMIIGPHIASLGKDQNSKYDFY